MDLFLVADLQKVSGEQINSILSDTTSNPN